MFLFYSIGIRLYNFAIHLASLFNPKAKLWVQGRKNWRNKYFSIAESMKNCTWFHCASLGEFEMARPLIERLKKEKPNQKILISFFSPSGFEIRKNYDKADLIVYLPLDTKKNAKDFIQLFQPSFAVFVKYEIWLNYLSEIQIKKIDAILISATFNQNQRFFKWNGKIFRDGLKTFKTIYVQNENSQKLLSSIQINSIVAGDTRYDQVKANLQNKKSLPVLEKWINDNKVIIAGSSWETEENLLIPFANKNQNGIKIIIAPHDISSSHINQIKNKINIPYSLYSNLNENDSTSILIIDNIGLLSSIYQYGNVAIIGGGFSGKLHNILEAATFGLPILFGPKHSKFQEAKEFISENAAFVFTNENDLSNQLSKLISNDTYRKECGNYSKKIVERNLGASEKIWNDNFISF